MHSFVLVDLQYLLHVTDVHRRARRYIARGGDRGEPLGGADQGEGVQRRKGAIRPLRCKTAVAVRPFHCRTAFGCKTAAL